MPNTKLGQLKHNLGATSAPGVGDDASAGYSPGSLWLIGDACHVCLDASVGAAVWSETGGAAAPADVTSVSGFTVAGTGSFVHATANVLPAAETMVVAFSYTPTTPTGDEYIWCKGLGASNGWAAQQKTGGASSLGQLRFQQTSGTRITFDYLAEHIGKDMHFLFQRNASRAELWGRCGADGKALMVGEDTSPGAVSTNTNGPAIGNYQAGTAGSDGPNAATCAIIGCGYGTTFLSEAQIQTYFDACAAQGTVPADASFPGAVSVYQEANGIENDQVGANNLTRKENTPGDLVSSTAAADYHSVTIPNTVALWGQSNADGQAASTGFTSIGAVDYTAAYALAGLAVSPNTIPGDVDDSGGATGTGVEVALTRQLVSRGATFPVVLKYSAGGTGLDVEWDPATGAQWAAGVEHIRSARAATLRKYEIRSLVYIGLESDAADAGAASRVVANLGDFCDAFETEYSASLASSFVFVFSRLSDNQTSRSELATVQAGLDTFVSGRANAVSINTDALTYPDNLHMDAASIVGDGLAIGDAIYDRANKTATLP